MKKVFLAAIVTVLLFSCKKDESVKANEQTYYFRAEGVSIDGHIDYSPIVMTKQ